MQLATISLREAGSARIVVVGSGAHRWAVDGAGATTSVLLAASPLLDAVTGRYFEDSASQRSAGRLPPPRAIRGPSGSPFAYRRRCTSCCTG